jgi:hypothetical protein
MLKNKLLSNLQKIVELFVEKVIIYEDRVLVKFTFTKIKNPHLTFDLEKNRNNAENKNPPDESLEDGYINYKNIGEINRDATKVTSRGVYFMQNRCNFKREQKINTQRKLKSVNCPRRLAAVSRDKIRCVHF